jgi:hypothetical protein
MKSTSRRYWEQLSWLPAIRSPDEWRPSDRLCISCTQTELPAAQQRKLVERWCELLPTLEGVRVLQFESLLPQDLFDAACRMKHIESLWVKHSKVKQLDGLLDCRSLRHLYLGNSAQIQSIDPLAGMSRLKSLYLENIKHITELSPLSVLTRLEDLGISGGIWGLQKVESLAPLASLKSLIWLDLGGVKCLDESLRPLAALRKLQRINVNRGEYTLEELAWLAATFSAIDHKILPYSDFSGGYSIQKCKKCSQRSLVLLFGKGRSRNICKDCDAMKLAKHVDDFNRYVAEFGSR